MGRNERVVPSERACLLNKYSTTTLLQWNPATASIPASPANGDSEEPERELWNGNDEAKKPCADCDLLKLAHHGSRNGTDRDWLELVKPKRAVASCGLNNKFHHPHKETLDLLAEKNLSLSRTEKDGTVQLESDGAMGKLVDR